MTADDEEIGEGMERCVSCGQETPADMIEWLDDCYLGQCEWCSRG